MNDLYSENAIPSDTDKPGRRAHTFRLLGAHHSLVSHCGANTSVKISEINASGEAVAGRLLNPR